MTARIVDGKGLAALIRTEIKSGVDAFVATYNRPPGLHVVLVGEDPASQVYVRNKERASLEVGMNGNVHRLSASTDQSTLEKLIDVLNEDPHVDGILVQLPLPSHLNANSVINRLSPKKDVDGLHPMNAGLLALGQPGLRSCTPKGCMDILKRHNVALEGARALVIGRSNLVGKPLATMLLEANATVTMAHSRTKSLKDLVGESDIVAAAVGRPEFVKGDWIKNGAVVLDVGINRQSDGKLVGDVAFKSAAERASLITPVPGGVGAMTIAMLLQNTLEAAHMRAIANS